MKIVKFKLFKLEIFSRKLYNLTLVSHWHANFLRLFCEFVRTFAQRSWECRMSVLRIFMCRELVTKFLNRFKNFMRIFSPKYFARLSGHYRATVLRVSHTCRREISVNLQCKIFATLVQMSYLGCTTILRKHANTSRLSGKKIKLSDIRDTLTNVARLSYKWKWK